MLDKILIFCQKYNMLPRGASVLCGLSGGADSICLTAALFRLRERLDITVEAIHVNHCLRGTESDRDEAFCREFCKRLGIKLTVVSCDVNRYAAENSLSTEEAARILRYKAFSDNSVGKLTATAHNANDNLETVILNLTRGTALKGLTGIPPVRDNIIRPLLTVTRFEIENFLAENNLTFITDSTNLSDDYTRNKIRHNVIPTLMSVNSSAVNTSISSIDALREENSFIESEALLAFECCRCGSTLTGLNSYHPVIRKRCIARLLSENSLPYSYQSLSAADRLVFQKGKINISGEMYLTSDGKSVSLKKIGRKKEQKLISAELKLGENPLFPDRVLLAELISSENLTDHEKVNINSANCYLDYDKIKGRAIVRSRRFGDKIALAGKNFTSSVKKLINEKIPAELKDKLYFIEDESGTIFAENLGTARQAAPDENTVSYLRITVKER